MGCSSSSDVSQSVIAPKQNKPENKANTHDDEVQAEKILSNKHKSPSGNELITFPKKRIKETFLDQTKPTKGKDDYILNPTGIYEKFLDFRSEKISPKRTNRPNARGLWIDPDFNPEIVTNNKIDWIRPKDYCKNPRLFVGGFGRQDIQQGCIEDCYFLAFISGLAERPDLMSKVIPYDAYLIERPDYDGIFHCRFWNFGVWEDVYVDDFIPTIYKRESIVSARSTEKNEMWVTLLEKAWAKFCGGYDQIETGDLIMDAHRSLTGGMSQMMLFQDKKRRPNPEKVFTRLESSLLRANTTAAATVGEASDGKYGLEGDHAFSITGTARAKMKSGEEIQLVCLRNPWGGTEWTGPWSDRGKEWDNVVSGVQKPTEDEEGEFYVSVTDFCKYFESCTICDLTPDINGDGTGEELGANKDGFVPLGLSLVQKEAETDEDMAEITINLYKVLGEKDKTIVVEQIHEYTLSQIQVHGGTRVTPGKYLALALRDPPKETQCLFRLFTMGPIRNIRLVPNTWDMMSAPEKEKVLNIIDANCNLEYKEEIWGRWIKDINLGGQICETRFDINPQLDLFIPDTDEDTMPKDTNWFWEKDQLNQTIKSVDGKIEGWEWNYIQPGYVITPGRYCVVLYHSEENIESTFCLIVKSASQLQIKSYHIDKDDTNNNNNNNDDKKQDIEHIEQKDEELSELRDNQ